MVELSSVLVVAFGFVSRTDDVNLEVLSRPESVVVGLSRRALDISVSCFFLTVVVTWAESVTVGISGAVLDVTLLESSFFLLVAVCEEPVVERISEVELDVSMLESSSFLVVVLCSAVVDDS